MVAAGQNVKRLLAFGWRTPKKPAQAAALRPPGKPRRSPSPVHRAVRRRVFQQTGPNTGQGGKVPITYLATPYERPETLSRLRSPGT